MILEKGDMWSVFGKTDLFCITTNSTINSKGELIMGKGIALEAKLRMPSLPKIAGLLIHPLEIYGFIYIPSVDQPIGLFQTKKYWGNKSQVSIILRGVIRLNQWINNPLYYKSDMRIDLNFPGINNGGLTKEEVLPAIYKLPDYVHIWELE